MVNRVTVLKLGLPLLVRKLNLVRLGSILRLE